jgi:hypothetical protein
MAQLVEAAFSGVNIAYTMLLLLILLYWIIVIVGVIDLDAFDFDAGAGAGAHDAGLPDGTAGGFSWLAFFNVGEAPIMFFVSIVILTMWVLSVQLNYSIDQYGPGWMNDYQGWIAAGLALPNLIFGFFVAKFAAIPFKRLSKEIRQRTVLVGKVGTVTSLEVNGEFGRVALPQHEGALVLNVRTKDGEVLRKGDAALIIKQDEDGAGDICVVTKDV